MNKKNILLVTTEFPPQPGGIGNHAYHLANQLQKNNYNLTVLTDNRSANANEEKEFDKQCSFRVKRIVITSPRFFMYFKRFFLLLHLVKENDQIIASGKFSLWVVAFVSLFYKRNYVAIIHGTEVNFQNKFLRFSIKKSLQQFNTVIAVSYFTKSLAANFQLKNIQVIPNGIDISSFSNKITSESNLKGSPKLITVGNVTDRKGQLNVVKALPDLLKDFPEIHYHCVGLPTEREAFLKEAIRLGVEKQITFHGRVSEAKLHELLQQSDIFVMLSNTTKTGDLEGFGIAILEANYFGKPAIGSSNCGIEDAIENGKTGFLIANDNSEALGISIKNIKDDYSTFSENSRQWAAQNRWSEIIKQYLKIMNS